MSPVQSERSRLSAHLIFVAIAASNLFVLQLYWKTVIADRNLLDQDFLGYYTAASLPPSMIYDINQQRNVQTNLLGQPYGVPAGVLLFVARFAGLRRHVWRRRHKGRQATIGNRGRFLSKAGPEPGQQHDNELPFHRVTHQNTPYPATQAKGGRKRVSASHPMLWAQTTTYLAM